MKISTLSLTIVALLLLSVSCKQEEKQKPNVLFIAIDDLNSYFKGMNAELQPTENFNKKYKK